MCGIAGIVNLDGQGTVSPERLKQMADSIAHRGPDDEGFFCEGPVGLAHRRLSIIDVRTGHQPLFNEDESVVVVFNGEIYNHETLRKVLETKGHIYRTHSDTESIVHAYEEFGSEFESHLTGMWGFAIWDRVHRRLTLSRDRLGIKPLYYTIVGNQLIFASEIKAILEVPGVSRQVDLEALEAYLGLRYVPGPKTMFRDIFKLQPGHTLLVERGKISVRQYWDLTFHPEPKEESQLQAELHELLFEVCRSHLMSEVPYGVFLSGGLDSSAVVAVLRDILQDRIQTFTVGYEHAEGINEFDYAGRVSRAAQTEHHEFVLSAKDFSDWIPQLVWHLDEPVGDAACIPLYFLAREAKPHATVLQSGEGADEIFAGYSIYRKMQTITRLQGVLSQPVANFISRCSAPLAGQGKLARYLRLFGKPLSEGYRGVSGHFLEGMTDSLVRQGWAPSHGGKSYAQQTFSTYYDQVRQDAPLNQMLFVDTKTWLPDDLLIKADKMTMAASVELRVPFLDHRLVEFASRLPVSAKIHGASTKHLLKQVMEPYLPRDIIYRSKKGFPVPVADWFRHGLYDVSREVMLRKESQLANFVNLNELERLLRQHKAGSADHSNELWGLLALEYWFHTFKVAV
jgi:asparagine synthase (glutamine-hydrolysing)